MWAVGNSDLSPSRSYKAEILLDQAQAVFWQGRFGEAETLAREVYRLSRKIRPQAANMLSDIYYETGRFDDSLRLALSAIQILDAICAPSDAYYRARAYAGASRALIGLRRWDDATAMFDRLEALLVTDQALWAGRFKNSRDRGLALLRTGQAAMAAEIFEADLSATGARLGPDIQ